MIMLIEQLGDPTVVLLPLAYGLAAFVLLMLIYRWLGRFRALRGVAIPYTIGALTLAVAIGLVTALNLLDMALDDSLRAILLSILVLSWSFVAIGLGEELLLDRWIVRRGATVPRLARDIARALVFIVVVLVTIRFIFEVPLT